MQTENRLIDDLAKIATSALGSLKGARDEMEVRLKDQLERIIHGMDLVRREEFEVVRAMAAKARSENEALAKRIAALEPKPQTKAQTKAKDKAKNKTEAKTKAKPRRAAKPAARAKPAAARPKTARAAKPAKPRAKKGARRTTARR